MDFLKNFCLIFFPFSTIVSSTEIELPEPEKECADFCFLIYEPLCATNGFCYKRFSNSCFLGIENCLAEQNDECPWDQVPDSYCDCPTQCAYTYSPVCAVSKTKITLFASECSMLETECLTNENYIIVPTEVCMEDEDEDDPICAFNGFEYVTFKNQYILDITNYFHNYAWAVFSFGECPACLIDPYYSNGNNLVLTVY